MIFKIVWLYSPFNKNRNDNTFTVRSNLTLPMYLLFSVDTALLSGSGQTQLARELYMCHQDALMWNSQNSPHEHYLHCLPEAKE